MRTSILILLATLSQGFDPCDKPKIDALLWGQEIGQVYVFNDKYFWHHDVDSQFIGPQMVIKDYWPAVQTPIDSVTDFDNGTKHILFIKGFKYWVYASKNKLIEKKQNLVLTGTYASLQVKKVDAIQIKLEFPEDRKGVICDGKQIFFCSLKIDDHMTIDECESHNQYRTALHPQTCEAICKYDDNGWYVASGQSSYVITNGSQSLQFMPIRQNVYQCKEKVRTSVIFLIAGCGILTIAILLFVFIIVMQKLRHKQQLPEEVSVYEDEKTTVQAGRAINRKVNDAKVNKK